MDAVPDLGGLDARPTLLSRLALARGELDRAADVRADPERCAALWQDPTARVLLVHRGRTLVGDDATAESAVLVLLDPATAVGATTDADTAATSVRVVLARSGATVFLGLLLPADADAPAPPEGARWADLRSVGAALDDLDAGLLVPAVALANWHASHPRCPRCGVATEVSGGGWARTCPDDGSQHFPRSDPAVIVLVTDGADRALLGRRTEWAPGWFSTLAGFVEAGESAELAVVREIAEEAGVAVDRSRLRYLGSQPWPFPSSLMLGYHAPLRSDSPPAVADGEEIHEVRWFTRAELHAACEDGSVRIPPPVSIARRLIEDWYGAELPGSWSRP
jgi:NAD+ diphosphatase